MSTVFYFVFYLSEILFRETKTGRRINHFEADLCTPRFKESLLFLIYILKQAVSEYKNSHLGINRN